MLMPRVAVLACVVALPLLCGNANARRNASGYHHVSPEVASSHIPWAKPLASGPIRVLFVAPRATLRDVVELAQRIDIDYEVVAFWDSRFPGCDPRQQDLLPEDATRDAVLARWAELLKKDFHVIVLGNLSLAAVPESLQQKILDKVEEGTGLLTACLRDGDTHLEKRLKGMARNDQRYLIAHGMGPSQPGNPGDVADLVTTGTLGGGRVVQLRFPGDPPRTHFAVPRPSDLLHAEQAYLENAYSLAARAIRWAAGRDGPVYIAGLHDAANTGPNQDEIPPWLPKEFVEAASTPATHGLLHPFVLELDRPAEADYRVITEVRRPGDRQRERFEDPELLPRGSRWHWLDLFMGPGEYWVDVWLMDRKGVVDWYTAPVRIEGWPTFSKLKLSKNYLLPHDALEVYCTVPAIFRANPTCTILARGVDSLGREVARSTRTVSSGGGVVTLRLGFADLLAPLVRIEVHAVEGGDRGLDERRLRAAFRESVWLPVRRPIDITDRPRLVVMTDRLGEYNERFYLRQLARQGVDMVWTPGGVPAIMEAARSGLSLVPQVISMTPTAILNGHERQPCLTDPVYHRQVAAKIQEGVLRHWAGGSGCYSLGRGNCLSDTEETVCWSPTCRTAYVKAYPDADLRGGCPQRGDPNWPRFARFMQDIFTGAHGLACREIRRLDPAGRVGFVARPDQALPGCDWAGLARTLDYVAAPPSGTVLDKLRDFGASPGVIADLWRAGEDDAYRAWLPWFALLHQAPTLWLPDPMGTADTAQVRTLLLPDGRVSPALEALLGAERARWEELGALLLRAEPAKPRILIYDSPINHLSAAVTLPKQGLPERVSALGYAYQWVDRKNLASMEPAAHPVLVLPRLPRLSAGELKSIQGFVERGGRLLADALPGISDEQGEKRPQSPLTDLFGEGKAGWIIGLQEDSANSDMRRWLEEAGCEPVARTPKGEPARLDGILRRFQFGEAEILACLASPRASGRQNIRLSFPRQYDVYDLLAGAPVSRGTHVRFKLAPGEVRIFSALPKAPSTLSLLVPDTVMAGKRLPVVVDLAAQKEMTGRFLVRVSLVRPDGRVLRHYTRVLPCEKGLGDLYIPLSLNEPGGNYTVTARDLLTGLNARTRVKVVPRIP